MKNLIKSTSIIVPAGFSNKIEEAIFTIIRKCQKCVLLRDENLEGYYVYSKINEDICDSYLDAPLLAYGVYKIDSTFKFYPISFLKDINENSRKEIFKEWLCNLEEGEIVLVFSSSDYNMVKECITDEMYIPVVLCEGK